MKDAPSPSNSISSSMEAAIAADSAKSAEDERMCDFEAESNSSEESDQQMSKLKAILQTGKPAAGVAGTEDISNVLRANPNISMRELFHGEEDMGLHFKAPFGSAASQRTPEGWTRVQTFLQYDEPTRRLWEELQKPYGNQSSFLRHLILLEKYYRNGDLILSPSASSNASVYTQTTRQRLVSFDEGHCGGYHSSTAAAGQSKEKSKEKEKSKTNTSNSIPTVEITEDDEEDNSKDAEVQIVDAAAKSMESILSKQLRGRSASVDKLTKQLSSNAVTITARPRDSTTVAAVSPQKSLLKEVKEKEATASVNLMTSNTVAASNNSRSILKTNLLGHNKAVEIVPISSANISSNLSKNVAAISAAAAAAPPDSKQQKILDVANKLLGSQIEAQQKANTNAQQPQTAALLTSPPELVSLNRRSSAANSSVAAAPSSLTSSLIANKRPQLMPNKNTNAAAGSGGNRNSIPPNVVILPDTLTPQELMQSKSWRPTLMPVSKNQHLMNKSGPLYQTADGRRLPALVQVQSGGKPFLISIFDYNRMCILRREKLLRDQMLKANKNSQQEAKQLQQQQQQLIQKQTQNYQGHKNSSQNNSNNAANSNKQQQVAQHQLLQLQLMSLQKQQQQQQQQAFKSAFQGGRYQNIAPKPPISSSASSIASSINTSINPNIPGLNTIANSFQMPMLTSSSSNSNNSNSNNNPQSNTNTPWLWNNFPDANQLLLNGAAPSLTAAGSSTAKLPQLLSKPVANAAAGSSKQLQLQQQQQLLLDNALMSKIPKSLTVIPQHKLLAAAAAAATSVSSNTNVTGSLHQVGNQKE